ncbi:hypothetical protein VMF7928_00220 [Vibrio marisflavi CECT 7928]|uniref:DUF3540 domain-containing protein n=2 Tax=Vibrio marisflavi TaxID=1216040 RepID=A0ABM8ZZ47_9VIBR|nr:hypothetical protein VMF7928_00220 [Vibrio marisflavi CECT 7928]
MAAKITATSLNSKQEWLMHSGVVTNQFASGFQVKCESGLVGAQVAASCLLQPNIGDRVLCSGNSSEAFILAVLERSAVEEYQLHIPGDLNVQSSGRMTLKSDTNLTLSSNEQTELTSDKMNVEVREATMTAQQSHFIGQKSFFHVEKLSWIGKQIEQVADRVFQRFNMQTKKISGHEEKQTKSSRHLIEKDYVVQSQNSLHHAEKNMHLDGEKIHLG